MLGALKYIREKATLVRCLLGFHFTSFLFFSALLGEPYKAPDCVKVKCTRLQLGGEGQRRVRALKKEEHELAKRPKLGARGLGNSGQHLALSDRVFTQLWKEIEMHVLPTLGVEGSNIIGQNTVLKNKQRCLYLSSSIIVCDVPRSLTETVFKLCRHESTFWTLPSRCQ